MICRVADTKYKATTGLSSAQKLGLLLDDLFVVVNFQRRDANFTVEEISESDDEY